MITNIFNATLSELEHKLNEVIIKVNNLNDIAVDYQMRKGTLEKVELERNKRETDSIVHWEFDKTPPDIETVLIRVSDGSYEYCDTGWHTKNVWIVGDLPIEENRVVAWAKFPKFE